MPRCHILYTPPREYFGLTDAGLVVTTGAGRRGSPRVYWLPERAPAPVEAETESEARILAAVREVLAQGGEHSA